MSNITPSDIIQDERIKEQSFGKYENTKLSDFIQAAIKAGGNFDEFCLETMENNKSVKNRTYTLILGRCDLYCQMPR